jgi:hypothetical protein
MRDSRLGRDLDATRFGLTRTGNVDVHVHPFGLVTDWLAIGFVFGSGLKSMTFPGFLN